MNSFCTHRALCGRLFPDRCNLLRPSRTGESPVAATAWPFIDLNDGGVAFIQGTRTKVTEIVECHLAYKWDAEQIYRQLGGLSLPQIHAALGYYYEHQAECDAQLESSESRSEELRRECEDSALMQKLRSKLAT